MINYIKNNKMTLEQLNNFYFNYLRTPMKQWDGKIAPPCREKIVNAFKKEVDKTGQDLGYIIKNEIDNGKEVYLWSDQHFRHSRVIEYAGRPFANVEQMNQTMINNHNNTVNDGSVVVFGGDITFGNEAINKEVMEQMKGRHLFIYGNHDFNHGGRYNTKFMKEAAACALFQYEINGNMYDIVISHYPILCDLPDNVINIYGHTHQHVMLGLRFSMCVEQTNYKPKSWNEFLVDIKNKLS